MHANRLLRVSSKTINNEIIIMASLTILAAMLRWPGIESPLTGDEGITFNRYGLQPWKDLLFFFGDTNQHTLFSILSNFCMQLFGENELYFRLPSFLAGIFAITLSYPVSRFFLGSKVSAVIASCLLSISSPHLSYSQVGRGYTLTVFLSLLFIFSATKLLQKRNAFVYGVLLVLSGFCAVATLPTNAFFLAAIAVYCFAMRWEVKKENEKLFNKNFIAVFIAFLFLFFLVVAYFYIIHEGLKAGISNHSYVTISLSKFSEIGNFLVSPWGPWLYLFFIYGWFSLDSKQRSFQLFSIFLTPFLLVIITGIIGFPRVYIYFLPFVLMLVAQGIATIASKIKQFHQAAGYTFMAILLIGMIFSPIRFLVNHYNSRYYVPDATMAEAKQVLSYVQENIPRNQLIVILSGGPERSVLIHYLKTRIQEDMFSFVQGEKPDKIIFISHRLVPPKDYSIQGYFQNNFLILPHKTTKLIKTVGNLRLYEFNRKIYRFIPPVYDPDYNPDFERQVANQNHPAITIKNIENPKVLGKQALVMKKNTAEDFIIGSFFTKTVDIKKIDDYVLFIYVRKYGQLSNALLAAYDEKNGPPPVGILNMYFGKFKVSGSDFIWQMVFTLSPIDRGRSGLQEIIHLHDETSYFDGFQSFLLSK